MTGKETIHSGHFMVSKYDEESDNEENCDINQLNRIKKGFNFDQFDSNSNLKKEKIDDSLTKMMQFLSVAMEGQITNPKWNSFKGVQFNSRDKIRLNNIIWREYHMQFVKQAHAVVVKFAPALTETPQVHGDKHEGTKKSLYNVVLEGKYWKRQNDIIVRQYKKWRKYFKERCLTNPAYCHYFGGIDRLFGDDSYYNDSIYQIDDAPGVAVTSNRSHSMDSNDINNNSYNSSYLSIQTNGLLPASNNNIFSTTTQSQNQPQNLYEPLFNRIQLQSHPNHHSNNNFMTHNLNNHHNYHNQQSHHNSIVSWHSQAGIAPTHTCDDNSKFNNKHASTANNNNNRNYQHSLQQSLMSAPLFMTSSMNQPVFGGINLKPRSSSPPPNLSDVFMDLDDHLLMPLSEYGAIPGEHHCQVIQPQLNNLQPRMESTIDFLNDFIYEAPSNALKSQRNFASESSIHSYPHYIPQAPIHKQSQPPIQKTMPPVPPSLPSSSSSCSSATQPNNSTRLKHPNSECKQIKLENSQNEINSTNGNVFCKTPNLLSMLLQPIQTTTNNVNLSKCKGQPNKQNGSCSNNNILLKKSCTSSNNHNHNIININSNNNNENSILSQSTTRINSLVKTQSKPNVFANHITQYSPNNSNVTDISTNSVSNSGSTRSSGDSSTFSGNILNSASTNTCLYPTKPHNNDNNENNHNRNTDNTKMTHSNIRELLLYQQPQETPAQTHPTLITVAKRRCSGPPIEPTNPFSCHTTNPLSSSTSSSSITRKPPPSSTNSCPPPPPTSSTNTLVQHYIDELSNLLLHHHTSTILPHNNSTDTSANFLLSHSQASSNSSNNKVSKAALLQKAADTIKRLRNEKHRLIEEIRELHSEIDMLQNQFSNFCSKLPANGVCVKSPTKSCEPKKWFNEFVVNQSQANWKFYLFYILFESLFTSYDNSVSTQSMDEMVHNVAKWLEKECSLVKLRLIVINGMRNLSRKTSIVQHPTRLSEEVTQLLYQHHHHHHTNSPPVTSSVPYTHNLLSMRPASPPNNRPTFYDNYNNAPFQ